MIRQLRSDAETIVLSAINAVLPDQAVRRALQSKSFHGRLYLIAVGKAAWRMAQAAMGVIETPIAGGAIISKYGHIQGEIHGLRCFEAGHPIPDENSIAAAHYVLSLTEELDEQDTVLFLLSGGGSALFEFPLIPLNELQDITSQLLSSGADITEINIIRKRLSAVKGGRFGMHCAPAHVEAVVLSDVLGDSLDIIASGPVSPDSTTCAQALAIAEKYHLSLSENTLKCLRVETPKELSNVSIQVMGSVRELCSAAEKACRKLGYEPCYLTDRLNCEAREAGYFLSSILQSHAGSGKKLAFLAGGETIVHLQGSGLGGRNQELALAACEGIAGLNAAVISVGSDGTDGPTDAAGGYTDGDSFMALKENRLELHSILHENDSYHALKSIDGLIFTGPTGTNVNDIAVALLAET